jgi:hypothetical protein
MAGDRDATTETGEVEKGGLRKMRGFSGKMAMQGAVSSEP